MTLPSGVQESKQRSITRELQLWSTLADHDNVATISTVGREFSMPVFLSPLASHGSLRM